MRLLALDPGPNQTAYIVISPGLNDLPIIYTFDKVDNDSLLTAIRRSRFACDHCVIEQVKSFGMVAGESLFETVFWSGRFAEAFGRHDSGVVHRIPRIDVKMHICHDSRAKDGNIRQALIDRFGGKEKAIGKKKTPGILYGIKADCWQALALAVTWCDKNCFTL